MSLSQQLNTQCFIKMPHTSTCHAQSLQRKASSVSYDIHYSFNDWVNCLLKWGKVPSLLITRKSKEQEMRD